MMRFRWILLLLLVFPCADNVLAEDSQEQEMSIQDNVGQLVVTVTESWESSRGKLRCYVREGKNSWEPVFDEAVPVLLGSNGLAWGRGVLVGKGTRIKREGDQCAPAGVFRIGKIYGEPKSLPEQSKYPYHQITEWDAWVDDPMSPLYNRHVRIDPSGKVPSWFQSQRMRLGDPAYRWLIEIRHNSDPPRPGYGSAIFFHTRRGPDRKTAGCTAMSLMDLKRLIGSLRAGKNPHYVILPLSEYKKNQKAWDLPEFAF